EPTSLQDREIPQQDVVAVLQRDRFVADPRAIGQRQPGILFMPAAEAFTPDQTPAKYGDVMQPISPDETLAPVIVAIGVVGFLGSLRLSRIESAGSQTLSRH